jgi:hypothetical protein
MTMSEEVINAPEPQTSGDESTIELMDGTADTVTTNVVARNVGELRTALGLTGNVAVNGVIASDSTPIRQGATEDDRDEVVHVVTNKRGGC